MTKLNIQIRNGFIKVLFVKNSVLEAHCNLESRPNYYWCRVYHDHAGILINTGENDGKREF